MAPKNWTFNHHPYVNRLYYIYGGNAYFTENGQRHKLLPGCLYLFPYGNEFSAEHEPNDPINHLYFDFSVVPPIFLDHFIEYRVEENSLSYYLIKAIELSLENEESKNDTEMVKTLFSCLLTSICNLFNIRRLNDGRINTVMEFIHENYNANLTNGDLANLVHLDTRHFLRIFKNALNVTPNKYLREYRMNISTSRLMNGVPIHEISEEMGYVNVNSFCNAFRKSRGISPAAYLDKVGCK